MVMRMRCVTDMKRFFSAVSHRSFVVKSVILHQVRSVPRGNDIQPNALNDGKYYLY
jgi:hypothetical protein